MDMDEVQLLAATGRRKRGQYHHFRFYADEHEKVYLQAKEERPESGHGPEVFADFGAKGEEVRRRLCEALGVEEGERGPSGPQKRAPSTPRAMGGRRPTRREAYGTPETHRGVHGERCATESPERDRGRTVGSTRRVLEYGASPSRSIYFPSPISTPEGNEGTKGRRSKSHRQKAEYKEQKRQDRKDERCGAEIQYNKIVRDAQDQAKAITERARAKAAKIVAAAEQSKIDTKHQVQEIEGTAVLALWDERATAREASPVRASKEKKRRRHKKEKKGKKHHRKGAKQSQCEDSPGY
jgi:hypothetical protein